MGEQPVSSLQPVLYFHSEFCRTLSQRRAFKHLIFCGYYIYRSIPNGGFNFLLDLHFVFKGLVLPVNQFITYFKLNTYSN